MRTGELTVPFEIKGVSDDGRLEGYGAIFGNVDLGLDRIEKGAFRESLKARTAPLPMLWQHMSEEPIGVWDELREDSKGLFVGGQLNLSRDSGQADVPAAWKARALAKQKAVSGLSIGYYPEDYKYEDDIRVLTRVVVREVSMATFPMNTEAQLTAVKRLTNREFIQLIRDRLGLTRNEAEALRADGLKGLRQYVEHSPERGDMLERLERLHTTLTT
jgi:HK97 family phage prohead protease